MKNGPYELVIAPGNFPGKKYRDRYAYEHTVVWWLHTGTVPAVGQIIHHKNHNKRDNRIENLELLTNSQHSALHGALNPAPLIQLECYRCGASFHKNAADYRHYLKIGQTRFYCGRSCQVKYQWVMRKQGFYERPPAQES